MTNQHGGKRSNSGRKPLPDESIRRNHSVKFSDPEWLTVQGLAAKSGMDVSKYIRGLIEKEIEKEIENND